MTRVELSPGGPQVSRIAAGCMRLADLGWDDVAVEAWIDACLNVGITTFDHADIYGDHRVVELFGRVLRRRPDLRRSVEIVSKCDIRWLSPRRPDQRVKSYDTSADYLVASVEGQLAALNVERLDVLLIHRPDPLMDADEVAGAFDRLRRDGKVAHFGVSNFTPTQWDLLASRTTLVTNQVQHSLLHLDPLYDGTFDRAQQARVRPMLWSPMGGGGLFRSDETGTRRLRDALDDMARAYGVRSGALALAWLLREPAGPVPVMSSSRAAGVADAAASVGIQMDRQDWFVLLEAATGRPVA